MLKTTGGVSFPARSPDRKEIAFSNGHSILSTIAPDGRDERELGVTGECAVWSPSATWLAFCHIEAAQFDVWMIRRDGSGSRSLVATSVDERPRGWSPDGGSIIFERDGQRTFMFDLATGVERP